MMTTQQRERIRVVERSLVLSSAEGARQTIDGKEYDHKFVASTQLLASDHGVIYVDGWRWDRYLKRPRWIANHDLGGWSGKITEVSLGRGVHVAIESDLPKDRVGESGKALVVYVRYARTNFAQEVRALYDEGGLDDVSVRWDWKTEVQRNPYQDEVEKFGEDLHWVVERCDLVELSAVLLGADAGAQVVRSDVVEAFERCRSKRIPMPELEWFIRHVQPRRVFVHRRDDPPVDINAAAVSLSAATKAVDAIKGAEDAVNQSRQDLANAITEIENLVATATGVNETEEDQEPSEREVALQALQEALGQFDLAWRDVGGARTAVSEALAQLAESVGLGQLVDAEGRQIDVAAILAEPKGAVTRLYEAFQRMS